MLCHSCISFGIGKKRLKDNPIGFLLKNKQMCCFCLEAFRIVSLFLEFRNFGQSILGCVCACIHVHMCEKFLCIISLSTVSSHIFHFFFYNSYISHIMLLGYVLCQSLCVFTLTRFQGH